MSLRRTIDVGLGLAALVVAWILKLWNGAGGNPDWILGPTSAAVGFLAGTTFVREAHVGYFSTELLFRIAPACAGVNFLVAAFCMSVFACVPAGRTARRKLAIFVVAGAASYATTLIANTIRILLAIALHQRSASVDGAWVASLHRLEGIVVYFVALSLLYVAGARYVRRESRDRVAPV